MDNDNFYQWLVTKKDFGNKSARDVLSRCHRVENMFNIILDDYVNSGLEKILQRIKKEACLSLKQGINQIAIISQLRRAVTLYSEYKKSFKKKDV